MDFCVQERGLLLKLREIMGRYFCRIQRTGSYYLFLSSVSGVLNGNEQSFMLAVSDHQPFDAVNYFYKKEKTVQSEKRQRGSSGPVARTPCSQCREARFNSWSGNWILHAATKISHAHATKKTQRSQIHKVNIKEKKRTWIYMLLERIYRWQINK